MKYFHLTIIAGLFCIASIPLVFVSAQREQTTNVKPQNSVTPNQMPPTLQCSAKNSGDEKPTYLVGATNLSTAEKKRIENEYGTLQIPKGEARRAKKIRADALARQK